VPGFEVDPERVRTAADGIEEVIGRMDDDLAALEADAGNYQDACGSDDIGTVISSLYEAIYSTALDSYSANLDELVTHAENLDAMADAYETTEQASAGSFDRLGPDAVV
jgi:hypothetical protein